MSLKRQEPLHERVMEKLRAARKEHGRPVGDIRVSFDALNALSSYVAEKFEEQLAALGGAQGANAILEWEGRPIVGDPELDGDDLGYRGMRIKHA